MRTPPGEQPLAADVSLPNPISIRTTDPQEARSRGGELLRCPHRIRVLDTVPFDARIEYRALPGLGLMSARYGAAVEIVCSPPVDRVTANFVHGGAMLIDDGGRAAVADAEHAATFSYHEELVTRWSPGMRQLTLTVEKPRVERFLQNLLHEPLREPLRLHTTVDLAGTGQGIAAAVRTLHRALVLCGKAEPPPVLVAELEHSVLIGLLLGQQHNYTDAIFSAQALPSPRVVRRVVELVDATPQKAFTVADLAAHAGVSERSLHSAFRRQMGTSPMSYVRRRRLEQAHEELIRVDGATGVRVTDVALRFGFTHAGRFAAAYRRRFGEAPSTTLRR